MADDIAPELLERVRTEYQKLRKGDRELERIVKRIKDGIADGKDLDAYAVREGELLAEALHKHVSGDILPNGRMYFNIADRLLPPVLDETFEHVADASTQIIDEMNARADIRIRAQRPTINEDRRKGLVDLVSTAERYDDIRKEFEADVVNYAQSVGTDAVRKNADFQYNSGMSPKVIRTSEAGCCKWCRNLAGTYDYATVRSAGNEVWQRHRDCRCVVEFDPGSGRRQNAHTKRWTQADDRNERVQRSVDAVRRQAARDAVAREERVQRNRTVRGE